METHNNIDNRAELHGPFVCICVSIVKGIVVLTSPCTLAYYCMLLLPNLNMNTSLGVCGKTDLSNSSFNGDLTVSAEAIMR